MTIQYAGIELLGDILLLEREAFSSPWSENSFREAFASDNTTIYAAMSVDGRLCGFSCLLVIGEEAELLNIAVSPAYRRRGIGDALLKRMFADAMDKGVETVYLEVRSQNLPAQGLYEKHGFQNIGRRRRYYTSPVDDAIVMQKIF